MVHLEQARHRIFDRRRIMIFGREEDIPDERRMVWSALPSEADGQLQLLQLAQFAFQLGDFEWHSDGSQRCACWLAQRTRSIRATCHPSLRSAFALHLALPIYSA